MKKQQNERIKVKNKVEKMELKNEVKQKIKLTLINKAFVGLGSCENVQTERSIFKYANWPRLQI